MMKLEFFADGSPDCPLLLLYGQAPEVVRSLAGALGALTAGELDLQTFPGIKAVRDCRVTARAGQRDMGIRQIGTTAFTWELTRSGWDQVAGLLEPFSERSFRNGFQWLERGSVSFIISDGRHW